METRRTAIVIFCMIFLTLAGTPALAERQSREGEELSTFKSFLGIMDTYLNVAERYVKMVSAEETTIYIVVEKMVEIYEAKGEKMNAVPELREILNRYGDNPTIRNVVHFKIAEIYKDTGQAGKALEELKMIAGTGLKR